VEEFQMQLQFMQPERREKLLELLVVMMSIYQLKRKKRERRKKVQDWFVKRMKMMRRKELVSR